MNTKREKRVPVSEVARVEAERARLHIVLTDVLAEAGTSTAGAEAVAIASGFAPRTRYVLRLYRSTKGEAGLVAVTYLAPAQRPSTFVHPLDRLYESMLHGGESAEAKALLEACGVLKRKRQELIDAEIRATRDTRGRFLPCCPEAGTGSGMHSDDCAKAGVQ
ncbi:MAG TPA: hypothetical protein VEA38_07155 [Terriglobales bacterium]|nr:hypothetical protein [Terriglobales bacterium]